MGRPARPGPSMAVPRPRSIGPAWHDWHFVPCRALPRAAPQAQARPTNTRVMPCRPEGTTSPLGSCQPRHDKPVTSHSADLCTNILNQNSEVLISQNQNSEVLISQIESTNFNNNSFTKFQKITSHMSKKLHAQITDALFTIFESIQSYSHSFIH
jgi:hypothetical protein